MLVLKRLITCVFETLFEYHFCGDPLEHPPNVINKIKIILETHVAPPSEPPIFFEFTKDAMLHNSKILQSFDHTVEELIRTCPHSDLSYGNELRLTSILEPLLHKHKDFAQLKIFLLNGVDADSPTKCHP